MHYDAKEEYMCDKKQHKIDESCQSCDWNNNGKGCSYLSPPYCLNGEFYENKKDKSKSGVVIAQEDDGYVD
jgi:hypothetical protein